MGCNVLIVDDSQAVRDLVALALEQGGLAINRLLFAANGAEALELARHHWIDVIITDVIMPEMDGASLVEHLKADVALRQIPVVVISGDGSQDNQQRLGALGIKAFVVKPFTALTLCETVLKVMRGRPVAPEN